MAAHGGGPAEAREVFHRVGDGGLEASAVGDGGDDICRAIGAIGMGFARVAVAVGGGLASGSGDTGEEAVGVAVVNGTIAGLAGVRLVVGGGDTVTGPGEVNRMAVGHLDLGQWMLGCGSVHLDEANVAGAVGVGGDVALAIGGGHDLEDVARFTGSGGVVERLHAGGAVVALFLVDVDGAFGGVDDVARHDLEVGSVGGDDGLVSRVDLVLVPRRSGKDSVGVALDGFFLSTGVGGENGRDGGGAAGVSGGGEWSKDNGVRRIDTGDLSQLGQALQGALSRDRGDGATIEAKIDEVTQYVNNKRGGR